MIKISIVHSLKFYTHNQILLQFVYIYVDLSVSAGGLPDKDSIRLVGGSGKHEGHVETYLLGHWVSVCSKYGDLLDATVVCRQLGYPGALAIPNRDTFFGLGNSGIQLELQCTGYESNITQCSHQLRTPRYCLYHMAGDVICSG